GRQTGRSEQAPVRANRGTLEEGGPSGTDYGGQPGKAVLPRQFQERLDTLSKNSSVLRTTSPTRFRFQLSSGSLLRFAFVSRLCSRQVASFPTVSPVVISG